MVVADISTITQGLLGVTSVVMPILVALAAKEICSYLKISSTSAAAQHVQLGVEALSDLAIDAITSAAKQNQTMTVNDAIAGALNQVSHQLTVAANAAGTTPENIVARVTSLVLAKLQTISIPAIATPENQNHG